MRRKSNLIGDTMQDSLLAILTDAITGFRYLGQHDVANTLENRMNILMGWKR